MSNSQQPPKPPSRRAAREARKAREAATAPQQYFQPPTGTSPTGQQQAGNTPARPHQVRGAYTGSQQMGHASPGPQPMNSAPTGPQSVSGVPTGPQPVHGRPTGPQPASGVPTGPQPVSNPSTGAQPLGATPPRQSHTEAPSEGSTFQFRWSRRTVIGLLCYVSGILLYGLKHLIALPLIVVAPVAAVLIFVAVEVIIRLRGRATWAALGLAGVAIVVLRLVVGG